MAETEEDMEHEARRTRRTRPCSTSPASAFRAKSLAVIVASILGVLVTYALIIALVVRPPALGWLGFAIMSVVLLGLGALAPVAFERTRVSPQRSARVVDRAQRLLVIADSHCDETALCDEIFVRLRGAVAVHVVVPVRVSHLHFATNDESEEWQEAEQSMLVSVGLLKQRGISTTGSVGSDKPLESMTDALGSFPATQVLLATPPREDAYWLERGLLAKARALIRVPVTQVVVPPKPWAAVAAR
jgi:hypothetical protein